MQVPVRHIVFDIGQVLIRYDPDAGLSGVIPDAAERAWFLETVCTGDWNLEQDRGRAWAEAEALLIADWPDQAERIRAFRPNWHRMITGDIPATVALFEGLIDERRDVTMLTNFAADTFVEARARCGFLNRTRGVTVSGEVGLIKPDPAIYALHQQTFDLEPAATLFIDDNAANVAAAQAFGWQAVQYVGHDRLVADLAGRGVIPS
jgi:2-haloacid dehalogenase